MSSAIVLATAGWAAGWFLWGRPQRLADLAAAAERAGPGGRLIVVVPARDEAHVIGGLLGDLVGSGGVDRVIVVDDHSTDGTAAVAKGFGPRIEVVAAPPLPPGWTGKNWACHVGTTAAAAGSAPEDVLVFLDADVRLDPSALDAVRDVLSQRRGVLSVQPFHVTRRPDEQLSLFCGLVALGALGAGRRRSSPSGLCGPLVAARLADHLAVGGHESVRGEVIEDVALGRRYLAEGIPTVVVLGGDLVRFRMYPTGVGQLIEGWTKNLASGAGAVAPVRTALTALWITALGSAAVDVVRAAASGSGSALTGALVIHASFVVQVAVLGRRIGTFPWATAVLYPVPLAAFVGLFLRSAWRTHVRRRVVWRGRSLPTGGVRTRT
jgi:4,4'-diaponeurosporenoate glycosyltransferase